MRFEEFRIWFLTAFHGEKHYELVDKHGYKFNAMERSYRKLTVYISEIALFEQRLPLSDVERGKSTAIRDAIGTYRQDLLERLALAYDRLDLELAELHKFLKLPYKTPTRATEEERRAALKEEFATAEYQYNLYLSYRRHHGG